VSESPIFTVVCEVIEEMSTLSRLEARGTVRLAMKEAGLEPRDVTSRDMLALLGTVMQQALTSRGVVDVEKILERSRAAVKAARSAHEPVSAESIFDGIAGRHARK